MYKGEYPPALTPCSTTLLLFTGPGPGCVWSGYPLQFPARKWSILGRDFAAIRFCRAGGNTGCVHVLKELDMYRTENMIWAGKTSLSFGRTTLRTLRLTYGVFVTRLHS